MLESITIRNYQIHEKLHLVLDPKVTVIVGPNDTGKSAILRALRWVCLNNPTSGDTRHGAELSKVVLTIDGHVIVRKRGQKNIYQLDDQIFKAFRSEVPAAIRKLLNLSEINFQSQLDAHFWLSLPAPQVSRELNQIVNLGVIDRSLAWMASKARKVKAAVGVIEARIDEVKQEKKSLAWVIDADKELAKLEAKHQHQEALDARASRLESLLQEVQRTKAARDQLTQAALDGVKLVKAGGKVRATAERAEKLESIVKAIIRVSRLQQIKIPNLHPHQLQVEMLEYVGQSVKRLEVLVTEIETKEEELCQNQQSLKRQTEKLKTLMKDQTRCPMCGTPLSQSPVLTSTCRTSHQ